MRPKQILAIAVLLLVAFLIVFPPLVSGGISISLSPVSSLPVEHLYVTVEEIKAHRADMRDPSGWFTVTNKPAKIDLAAVNVTQTIALGLLPPGQYDSIRLKVVNATVLFNNTSSNVQLSSAFYTIPVLFFVQLGAQAGLMANVISDLKMVPGAPTLGLSFSPVSAKGS